MGSSVSPWPAEEAALLFLCTHLFVRADAPMCPFDPMLGCTDQTLGTAWHASMHAVCLLICCPVLSMGFLQGHSTSPSSTWRGEGPAIGCKTACMRTAFLLSLMVHDMVPPKHGLLLSTQDPGGAHWVPGLHI